MDSEKKTMEDFDEQLHASDVSTLDYTNMDEMFLKDTECEPAKAVVPDPIDYSALHASFDSIMEDASSRVLSLPFSLNYFAQHRIFDINPGESSVQCSDPKEFLANPPELQLTSEHSLLKADKDAFDRLYKSLCPPPSPRTSTPPVPKKEIPAENECHGEVKRKCKCEARSCLSGYCECFSDGGVCGSACLCTGCRNRKENLEEITEAKKKTKARTDFGLGGNKPNGKVRTGCKCTDPTCSRNYCFCRKNGRKCSDSCGCTNCGNKGKPPDFGERRGPFIVTRVALPQ